eukprot:11188192-Lingulodinium_polyedra.AAC.1
MSGLARGVISQQRILRGGPPMRCADAAANEKRARAGAQPTPNCTAAPASAPGHVNETGDDCLEWLPGKKLCALA